VGKSAELILVLNEVLVSFIAVVITALYSQLFLRVFAQVTSLRIYYKRDISKNL
jgi:hypothetical protein